jgi:hypothetical protein
MTMIPLLTEKGVPFIRVKQRTCCDNTLRMARYLAFLKPETPERLKLRQNFRPETSRAEA